VHVVVVAAQYGSDMNSKEIVIKNNNKKEQASRLNEHNK
jgi:hypothetical protein